MRRIFNAPINRRQTSFSVAMLFDELPEGVVGAMDRRGREGFVVGTCGRDCVDGKVSDKNEHEKPCETQLKSSNG